jgi:hypothetical protein
MPRWAFKANFTNCSRRAREQIFFHDIAVESAKNKMKCVTHVHAQTVTYVCASFREGELLSASAWFLLKDRQA